MQLIPPPNPRDLLPPLLACLPTAFASARPPPALLPLLSPILRQRLQLITAGAGSSDSWLTLLSWDASRASKLPAAVENMQVEPHPVSGEIEIEDVSDLRFRRLDHETLHASLDLPDFDLCPIYLWCTGDESGGGNGWRLAELRVLEDKEDGTEWFSSIAEAEDASGANTSRPTDNTQAPAHTQQAATQEKQEDDDDDYWAAYDRTPAQTPAQKRSPAPQTQSRVQLPTTSELEYFARYAAEVQPAMDSHDPDEEVPDAPESTLNGKAFGSVPLQSTTDPTPPRSAGPDESKEQVAQPFTASPTLSQPRPTSPGSSNGSVDKLEREAERQSQTETAIKQHISTDIKSLFRLARGVGMDREEFERVVKTELQLLSMMENDD